MLLLATLLAMNCAADVVPDRPNVEDWTIVPTRQLDARPGDYLKGLVGLVVVYQNPNDKNEFAKVYFRQVSLVSERPGDGKTTKDSGRATLIGDSGYSFHKKEEREAIKRVQKATDVLAYVRWHVTRDKRIEQYIISGNAESWLLNSNGVWAYDVRPELGAIKEIPLSEPSKYNPGSVVVVGIKYVLGDAVHVVRVDQDDLKAPKPVKKEKTGNVPAKKEGSSNEE